MYPANSVTAALTIKAGPSLLNLRCQKSTSENVPDSHAFQMMRVIKKPDKTKKISTPTYPPEMPISKW